MRKQILAAFLFMPLAFSITGFMNLQENPLASLVNAELAFSKLSETKGIREAFLACLADDGLVFRPGPVNGKKFYSEQKDLSGYLTWKPVFADISLAGDLGYTTGPYEYRKSKEDKGPASQGHYISIWRRKKDGPWRVVIDTGIAHPPLQNIPPLFVAPPKPEQTSPKSIPAADLANEQRILLSRDVKLGEPPASIDGFSPDYFSAMMPDIRFYRPNVFPMTGAIEARKALGSIRGLIRGKPEKADVSESGDLGFTYGTISYRAEPAAAVKEQEFYYLRIWKKSADRTWRIALEVSNLIPAR